MRLLLGLIAGLALAAPGWAATVVDHIQLGVPDLAAGSRTVAELTGVTPQPGGVHPGRGTANALLSLGGRSYLEVIAPAPGQPPSLPIPQALAALKRPTPVTFAVAASDLDAVAAAARRAGLTVEGPAPGSRMTPDGRLLKWRALTFAGHDFAGFVPFFIDWGDTPHPATTSPQGLTLKGLRAVHPRAAALKRIYDALGLDIPVAEGPQPMLVLEVAGPRGAVTFGSGGPAR
jgi:hypothetical protein